MSGPAGEVDVPASRGRPAPPYVVVPFVDRMDLAYAAADAVLCRAGANTVTEVSGVGLPAIYVPLPIGNGEQALNARPVIDAGGGLLVADGDLTPAWVSANVPALLTDPLRLAGMARAAAGRDPARRRREARRHDPGGGGLMRVPVPERAAARRGARAGPLRRHRRSRPVRHRPDHARARAHGVRQRRQAVAHARRAAGARRHLLRRPRRRRRCATPTRVVVSTAVREDNPEVVEAQRLGLRLLPRSAALDVGDAGPQGVAVAGTHGKTTTTSMLTVALQHCGADPSFAIGGELNESGLQRPRRHRRPVRGRGRRERRRVPRVLAVRRPGHQRRGRPPRQLGTEEAYHAAFERVPRPDRPRRLPGHVRRRRRAPPSWPHRAAAAA